MTFPFLSAPSTIIEPYFQEHFADESLKREVQRATVLSAIFLVVTLLQVIFLPVLHRMHLINFPDRPLLSIALYFVGMSLYELGVRQFLKTQLQTHMSVPTIFKFGNATFEITSITLIMYVVSRHLSEPLLITHSPLVYIYMFFIILSTLRLNFWLSIYTGFVAGLEFILLCWFIGGPAPMMLTDFTVIIGSPFLYVIKGGLLALGGVAAGYVSRQIRSSITDTIRATETEQKAVALFGQQVSPEIARAVLEQQGNYKSRHMQVAVMFLDIRDFTRYASRHTAEEVMDYQNTFFGIIIRIVEQYHGVVYQFLGDGCMITFGAPVETENPAEMAVQAGFAILDAIEQANAEKLMVPTTLGIGIHVGDAVVGNIGTETRQQYSVTGSVVILAARIEQLNKECHTQFLVSREVFDSLSDPPETARLLGPTFVKGVDEEIELYAFS
ncbi:adenylate cyclase [Fibrisoma limi BUZ 3]|uniref:Adenylate cyclase n=1 Tax=Fibrisoma limi BUZ 3 TaxID=1185876 RepID=I2GT81_9BACT|nr:adenylate/guanylate cyclase domain-containing protein [Fibrisoma limi]CCH57110.1 adenylate cyclase [Fibrisoma limi BUZ 3]